ncbi:hypothetical protein [Polaromonas sp. SM01]|uniref:hypothetical protein n=1 Tax=Polaromonas sp. SM01 TaxID=3085630 RepID=UPI00298181D6|nr:hypothetical protein [Polaromonas sp. SM01]MDW5445160.1 hypothetical protein [Polaromonas sp. SM01]
MQLIPRFVSAAGNRPPPVAQATPDLALEPAEQLPPLTDYALLGLIGAELSAPIYALREIVQDFTQTRRISHQQLEGLTTAIESANQITRQSQQIGRLAEGRLRQSHERIQLDRLLQQALLELAPTLQAQGIECRHSLKAVEVIVDPGLLSSLIDAALSWGCAHGQRLVISLSIMNWPEHGLLVIKAYAAASGQAPQPDSLNWHLLSQLAQTMGVTLEREVSANGESRLQLEFARTVRVLEGLTALEIDTSGDSSFHNGTKALAGLRILLISNEPLARAEVSQACRLLGLSVDAVPTVERGRRYMELDMPHLLIIDERLHDGEFDQLADDIKHIAPNLGLLEIVDDPNTFEISSWMGENMTRVSRDGLRAQLPSVLTLELVRAL